MTTGRCLKCKKKVEIKDGEVKTTKNNLKLLKGICPDCGTVVCRMLPKNKGDNDEHSGDDSEKDKKNNEVEENGKDEAEDW